jgi:hypothetical protein
MAFPGLEVAELGDLLWVRGPGGEEEAASILALVPAARFFDLLAPDRLRPRGRLVPTARLPAARFLSLRSWLTLRVPSLALPGETKTGVELRLVPGRAPGRPSGNDELLLTDLEGFRRFLAHAPIHRLTPLVFTVNGESEVLVRGTPLPPIPGERYVLRNGIAIPAGWVWTPTVAPHVLRTWLGLAPSTLAVWRRDGTIGEVPPSAFSPATRRVRHRL